MIRRMENISLSAMLIFILQFFVVSVLSSTEICPGGTSTCPDSATCCQLLDKTFGCCPLKDAVCCDDHIHCCPAGNKCEAGVCLPSSGAGNVTAVKVQDTNTCFGTNFTCDDEMPCCKGKVPGEYGCCPIVNGVCCPDGEYCCLPDTLCDNETHSCVSKMNNHHKKDRLVYDYIKYLPMRKSINVNEVICPDVGFVCPDGYTCCKLPNNDWGCCPYTNATCCPDHLHCCPENNQCDATSEHCLDGNDIKPSLPKKLAKLASPTITCPDNSTCAETMTCCQLHSSHYGCCAYENAVCCSDHEHCCPSNMICDVELKQCIQKDEWLTGVISKHYKKTRLNFN